MLRHDLKSGFSSASQDNAEECIRKARRKLGTAVSSKLQCWDKIEGKDAAAKPETVCPTGVMDEFDIDGLVKDFTLDIVNNEVLAERTEHPGQFLLRRQGRVRWEGLQEHARVRDQGQGDREIRRRR